MMQSITPIVLKDNLMLVYHKVVRYVLKLKISGFWVTMLILLKSVSLVEVEQRVDTTNKKAEFKI